MNQIKQPFDLLALTLDEKVFIKLRGGRELTGRLNAYDGHLNMVLQDVTEKTLIVNEDTEQVQPQIRNMPMLFVRGDGVLIMSPLLSNSASV
ncbi:hypothetical protein MIR68_003783 [Amoeboaphelidium protococcarum]|nr:hypothetical protein MIR68_003783 [Amoeboaphelidium protococcarum]